MTPTAATRLNDNFQTLSRPATADQSQLANSFNMNVTARQGFGLVVQGGFNDGKTDSDYCDVRRRGARVDGNAFPAQSPVNPWCDTSTGWVTRLTALGSYMIPRIDVQVAGTLRSDQGGDLAANWVAPNSATVGLNRAFAGVAGQTITVNLIEPGTLHGDRVNQFDIRAGEDRPGGAHAHQCRASTSTTLRNSAPVLSYDQASCCRRRQPETWLQPTAMLQSRFAKFSAQIDF